MTVVRVCTTVHNGAQRPESTTVVRDPYMCEAHTGRTTVLGDRCAEAHDAVVHFALDERVVSYFYPINVRLRDLIRTPNYYITFLERYVECGILLKCGDGTEELPFTYLPENDDMHPGIWKGGNPLHPVGVFADPPGTAARHVAREAMEAEEEEKERADAASRREGARLFMARFEKR